MRRRHLRGVLQIEHRVYPRPWSAALFLGELNHRENRVYVVARAGSAVVGYAGAMLIETDAHVTTIAVDPLWHRRGIATRMLALVCREAIAMGTEQITLEVRVSNDAAQGLYRAFGFAPAGIRKNYYAESKEDALIMWAHDVATEEYEARLDRLEQAAAATVRVDGFQTAAAS
jgi:ribosomal-protein-alanine N-acetyltransferase